jgi:hypothetical protein
MTEAEFYEKAAWAFGTGLFILFCWVGNRLVKNLDALTKGQNDHEVRIVKLENKNFKDK